MTLVELLRAVRDRKLQVTPQSVWNAWQHRALIQIIDKAQNVVTDLRTLKMPQVDGFRLTHRGAEVLDQRERPASVTMPINKADPPMDVGLWLSAFRRWCRNIPKGLSLAHSDGQLHVLAQDSEQQVENDDFHRLASVKVPWVE